MSLEIRTRLTELGDRRISRRIELLRGADLSRARIDRLKRQLTDLLRAYGMFALRIEHGKSIFRSRKHRAVERESCLSNVNRIYPQAKFIKCLGRANRKQHPVYYFGADDGIALNEVKASAGDVVTILECKPRHRARPFLVHIGIHQMARKYGAKIGGGFAEPEVRIRQMLGDDPGIIRKHRMIDDFISKEFLRVVPDNQEHLYKLTIAIAELLFKFATPLGTIDGLAYPSIVNRKVNANIAFLPDAFHRLYRPVACERVEIRRPRIRIENGIRLRGFELSNWRKAKRVLNNGDIEW